MTKELTFSIRNLELRALHWPGDSGVRILALHGWLDNAASFAALAECLPGHEIVALDFPGHGHSSHRADGELLHYIDYILDVHQVLKALGWVRCVLMGHSMGAGVASVFASAFPDSLTGLVCLDGLGPITAETKDLPACLARAVKLNASECSRAKKTYPNVAGAVKARHDAGDMYRSSVEMLVRRNLQRVDGGYAWRSDPRLRAPSMYYLSEPQAQAYISQIRVPVLMVRPAESSYKAEVVLRARAALVENLTWCDVPGGHHAHMDNPDALIPAIESFLASLD